MSEQETQAHYVNRHAWMTQKKGPAKENQCRCGNLALDWALIHGRDGSSLDDYVALCRQCHVTYDYLPKRRRNGYVGSYV